MLVDDGFEWSVAWVRDFVFRRHDRDKVPGTAAVEAMKHRDFVYDVEMHKGVDAEFYLRKGVRVIGVEVDLDLARTCRESLADFIAQGQLTIVAGAIVDSKHAEATVRFVKNSGRSVWETIRLRLRRTKAATGRIVPSSAPLVYSGASCSAAGAAWRFLKQRITQLVVTARSDNTKAADLGRPVPAPSLSPALHRRGRDRVARQLPPTDGALRPPARDPRRLLSARRAHPRILEVI